MATAIPTEVARDLDVPVIFANQTGTTRTTIPVLGLTLAMHIADRFAGHSSICGGRSVSPVIAGAGPQLVLSEVNVPEPHKRCSMKYYVPVGPGGRVFPCRHGRDRNDGLVGLLAGQPPSRGRTCR